MGFIDDTHFPIPGLGISAGFLHTLSMVIEREMLESVVRSAGSIALSSFRSCTVSRKADYSYVTEADLKVEEAIREKLREVRPEIGLIGEEMKAETNADGRYAVAIDPIDGTASFVAGIPTWSISLGLLDRGQPVAGVVYLPAVDEMYSSDADGAWFQGNRLQVEPPPIEEDSQAFILVHSTTHHHYRVTWPAKLRNLGSTAYHIALVARGVAVAALLGRPRVWDLAGGAAILSSLGGGLYGLNSGEPLDFPAIENGSAPEEPLVAAFPDAFPPVREHFRSLS